MNSVIQGSTNVPCGHMGQADFLPGRVTFHFHLPNGQGLIQVFFQLNQKEKVN